MSSGFGAGLGADMLQDIIRQKVVEAYKQQELQQEQQRLRQEQQRINMAAADRMAAQKDLAQTREQNAVKGVLSMTPPRTTVTPETAARARAAGFGDLVPHEDADLKSTAISGIADAGKAAPSMGPLRIVGAGRPERDTFTGTAEQLAGEQARTDALSAREQARLDRIAAAKDAAQVRADAAAEAQRGREDLVRLAASLRPPSAAEIRAADAAKAADAKTEAQTNEVQDALDVIRQIREDPARGASTGPFEGRGAGYVTAGPEGYERVKRLHNNLVDKLALAQAGKLKGQGQISNFEREMLKNAATALSMSLGDKDYMTQLDKLEQQFKRMLPGAPAGVPPAGPGATEFDWVPGKGLVPRKPR